MRAEEDIRADLELVRAEIAEASRQDRPAVERRRRALHRELERARRAGGAS